MTDYYANWKARLAGQTVKTFLQPQLEDAGYYRLPITNRKPNGQTDITGWVPVAMWVDGGELTGLVGAGDDIRDMSSDQLCGEQFWSWICRNPITHEIYKAVAEDGKPWPDSPAVQLAATMVQQAEPTIPAANREVTANHNAAPEEDNRPAYEIAAEKIDNARGVADTFEVKDLKTAEQALGIVNRLAELRLNAKRDGEDEYKPHYNKYKKLLDAWKPPIDRAEASEKALTAKINSWKRAEEKRLREEQAKADAERKRQHEEAARKLEEEEAAAARAMDRAIANGEPPSAQAAPVLELEPPVEQPAPAPVAPPVINLNGPYGKRRLRDTPPTVIVEITDYDKVYEFFKNTEAVRSCLMILAKASVKVNVPVPGVTTRNEE
jgi:hypothetical protein